MITAQTILKVESFTQQETFAAIRGIADKNETTLHAVVEAFKAGNTSVVETVEKHLVQAAHALADQLNS